MPALEWGDTARPVSWYKLARKALVQGIQVLRIARRRRNWYYDNNDYMRAGQGPSSRLLMMEPCSDNSL